MIQAHPCSLYGWLHIKNHHLSATEKMHLFFSNTREYVDQLRGGSPADSAADQRANEWGRNGGDPNKYRPKGLPSQY